MKYVAALDTSIFDVPYLADEEVDVSGWDRRKLLYMMAESQIVAVSESAAFLHVQALEDTVWTVNHNLGFLPDVTARNTGGQVLTCEVVHISANQLVITHVLPLAGTARCS